MCSGSGVPYGIRSWRCSGPDVPHSIRGDMRASAASQEEEEKMKEGRKEGRRCTLVKI